MTTLKNIPFRIPDQWDAQWYRVHVAEVLDPADVRGATLLDASGVATQISAHNADPFSHPDVINLHRADANPHTQYALKTEVKDLAFDDDWTDLVIAGIGVNPPGATTDPSRNATTGLLEFSGSADNVIVECWQMPHGATMAFVSGEVVKPHMHVRFLTSSTSNARFKFEYDIVSPNDNHSQAYGSFTTLTTVTVANPEDTTKNAIVTFGNLDMTGHAGSALIHFRVTRLANTDAADTYTGLVALYSLDLHYRVRRAGSETDIPVPP